MALPGPDQLGALVTAMFVSGNTRAAMSASDVLVRQLKGCPPSPDSPPSPNATRAIHLYVLALRIGAYDVNTCEYWPPDVNAAARIGEQFSWLSPLIEFNAARWALMRTDLAPAERQDRHDALMLNAATRGNRHAQKRVARGHARAGKLDLAMRFMLMAAAQDDLYAIDWLVRRAKEHGRLDLAATYSVMRTRVIAKQRHD